MIRAAVFETDPAARARLRDWLVRYLIAENRELDLLWFTNADSPQKLQAYAGTIQLAFVSLDSAPDALPGQALYRLNPACRICYYKTAPCDLEPLLPTRPIAFFLWDRGQQAFRDLLNGLFQELESASDLFVYEDRKGITVIPYSRILYLQSDLKHVTVYTDTGTPETFFAKLSEMVPRLDGRFFQIHKSYIVNMQRVERLDRKLHMVRLSSGETLPISDARYEKTLQFLRKSNEKRACADGTE